ncbi:ATP-binding response regulator [Vampirovibrio chlorellavorus]|uniref:ATP-binding response regulator n=1 Tax=Vampirovibrio chlorellavorus TaxID=758823 RepID=UPI0026EF1D1F|nr:response regulator [Vampirovibrio chlorellavorus]
MSAPFPPHPDSASAVADGPVRNHYRVLIVDDDDVVREGLVGYLENYHEANYQLTVTASPSAPDARQKLAEEAYDLVISDINMPEEDGFSLIQFIQAHYPQTRTAMITAYKVEDYVRNAKKTGVFNIIAKTAPFDFEELSTVVNNLLEPASAFGIETYMDPLAPLSQIVLTSSDDISVAFETLHGFLTRVQIPNPNDLLTAVIEAITNAVYHVAKLPDGSLKYEKGQRIERLEENEYVYIYYGQDLERIGIAIVDQGGRITADEILYWLDRNISGTGLMDTHGRGMYLIHRLVDRLLINIAPGQRTEIIMLNYRNQFHSANKPLYINQL